MLIQLWPAVSFSLRLIAYLPSIVAEDIATCRQLVPALPELTVTRRLQGSQLVTILPIATATHSFALPGSLLSLLIKGNRQRDWR